MAATKEYYHYFSQPEVCAPDLLNYNFGKSEKSTESFSLAYIARYHSPFKKNLSYLLNSENKAILPVQAKHTGAGNLNIKKEKIYSRKKVGSYRLFGW